MPKKQKGKKALRIWIIVILCLVIAAGGVTYARKMNSDTSTAATTYTVKTETYENVIEISGNVSAASSQSIQSSGDGTVTGVYVKEGDYVKKGQVILTMDATEQEYNLAKQDYDMDQKRISGSAKELELMGKQRAVLVKKLQDRTIKAVFSGVVAQLSVAVGDYIEASDEVGVLIDRSYLTASVEIVETDASKLQVGQTVTFTFPAYGDTAIEGYVVSFPSVGRITSRGATVIDAEVRINNPPESILPNYSFTGNIQISDPVTVTLVERLAIGYQGGKAYAEKILSDGTTERVSVEVQQYDATYVNVLSGLEYGDMLKSQSSGTTSGSLRITTKSDSSSSSSQQSGFGSGFPSSGGTPPSGGGGPGM